MGKELGKIEFLWGFYWKIVDIIVDNLCLDKLFVDVGSVFVGLWLCGWYI